MPGHEEPFAIRIDPDVARNCDLGRNILDAFYPAARENFENGNGIPPGTFDIPVGGVELFSTGMNADFRTAHSTGVSSLRQAAYFLLT